MHTFKGGLECWKVGRLSGSRARTQFGVVRLSPRMHLSRLRDKCLAGKENCDLDRVSIVGSCERCVPAAKFKMLPTGLLAEGR
jgi:hypothetical protein